jgi:H+/Cl- antiporter ClcA/CBS domain-containing protein
MATRHKPGDFTADRRILLLMVMAVAVGGGGVAAAWMLTHLIALCTNLAFHRTFSFQPVDLAKLDLGPTILLIPMCGGLIIGLMARFGSEKIRGHGIPEAMEAILFGKSRMEPKVAILKPLSSAISIGSGGPFGAEGPIIMTGGAIGSLFAQSFHMSAAERKTLLVAGSAAGMTAIFGTPIAAVLLAIELLLFEWKPRSFLPVAVAVVTAATLRSFVMDATPLFAMLVPAVSATGLLDGIIVGVIAGLVSGLLTLSLYAVEDLFHKLPIHWMWWPVLGGLAVGFGGLIDPAALGVGYSNIGHLLQNDMPLNQAVLLLGVKSVIWIIALSSGTSGGVLAPLLMIGAALGCLLGHVLPGSDPALFALFGMAAMMAGSMRAPLTATLFAVELTGAYGALLPLLAACAAAFAVTVLLLKRSILTEKIARRGRHISHEYAVDPFELLHIEDVMTTKVETLPNTMRVCDVVHFFTAPEARHRCYPVVDVTQQVTGLVTRGDAIDWADDVALQEAPLSDVVSDAGLVIGFPGDLVTSIIDQMAMSGSGRVPIIDPKTRRLVGLVSRRDLLQARGRTTALERERNTFLFRSKTSAS